jgi:hypothetical protein
MYVIQFEIMGLAETWVEEGSWKKNRKVATESVQMGRSRGKTRKEKEKSYRGNNNRGEIGDWRKALRKGRRERMHGKKRSYRQQMVENNAIYSKKMKTTRRRVEDAMQENRKDCTYTLGRGLQREKRRKKSQKLGRGEPLGKRKGNSKRNKKEKWVVGQRMWTIEEASSRSVKRIEKVEGKNREVKGWGIKIKLVDFFFFWILRSCDFGVKVKLVTPGDPVFLVLF